MVLFLLSLFSWSIPPTQPQEGISLGQFPYQQFTGTLVGSETRDLLTVPSGQVFVITAGTMDNELVDLYADSTIKVHATAGVFYSRAKAPLHVAIYGGQTLRLYNTYTANSNFYLEGHYMEENDFPYRTYSGTISSGQSITITTIPSGEDFVVSRLSTNGNDVSLYQDSTLMVVGASRAFNEPESSFNKGTANVLFPSGTSLILTNTGGYTRTYFVEGYVR